MTEAKQKFNYILDYIDEVIVLNCVEDLDVKLEYIRNYFINVFYSRNIKILKLLNQIIELYYLKNEVNFKSNDNVLRELILDWAKYEKSIS